jgi:hypothetical protein
MEIYEHNYDFIYNLFHEKYQIQNIGKIIHNLQNSGLRKFGFQSIINDDIYRVTFTISITKGRITSVDQKDIFVEINGVLHLNEYQKQILSDREEIIKQKNELRKKKTREYRAELKRRKESGNFVALNKGPARLQLEYERRVKRAIERGDIIYEKN